MNRRVASLLVMWLMCAGAVASARSSAFAAPWPSEKAAGPFFVHADFPLDTIGDLLTELQELPGQLRAALQISAPRETIHVHLFAKKATYDRYIKKYFPTVSYRRALFIKAGGPGMVFAFRSDQLAVDLRHECTHALLHAVLPVVPIWLDEGLAEYFEVPAKDRPSGHPHLGASRLRARLGFAPQLTKLERLQGLDDMGKQEYRDSWAWIHFLLHGPPEALRELRGYVRDLERRQVSVTMSEKLQSRYGDLDRAIRGHLLRW